MNILELRQSIFISAQISFSRSGGNGGQNVNKVNTKVTLRVKLDDISGITEFEKLKLTEKLKTKLVNNGKEIVLQCDDERSQYTNIKRAFMRLENTIISAARIPKTRHPTKPTKSSKEKRLLAKKLTSIKKTERMKHHRAFLEK